MIHCVDAGYVDDYDYFNKMYIYGDERDTTKC